LLYTWQKKAKTGRIQAIQITKASMTVSFRGPVDPLQQPDARHPRHPRPPHPAHPLTTPARPGRYPCDCQTYPYQWELGRRRQLASRPA